MNIDQDGIEYLNSVADRLPETFVHISAYIDADDPDSIELRPPLKRMPEEDIW